AAKVGAKLLDQTEALFDAWYRVRDGTRGRRWLHKLIEGQIRPRLKALRRQGTRCGHAPSAGTCASVLDVAEGRWPLASQAGREPTSNEAARALRTAVLKRKKSFASDSAVGCEYGARLYSVVQTLRRRGACVLDYLCETLQAHRHGLPAPPLPAAA